jgi:hypothetical protein
VILSVILILVFTDFQTSKHEKRTHCYYTMLYPPLSSGAKCK